MLTVVDHSDRGALTSSCSLHRAREARGRRVKLGKRRTATPTAEVFTCCSKPMHLQPDDAPTVLEVDQRRRDRGRRTTSTGSTTADSTANSGSSRRRVRRTTGPIGNPASHPSTTLRHRSRSGLVPSNRASTQPGAIHQNLFAAGLCSTTISELLPCLVAPADVRTAELERRLTVEVGRLEASRRDIDRELDVLRALRGEFAS